MNSAVSRVGLLLVALVVTACGTRVTTENYRQIEQGMTRGQVIDLLGKPDNLSSMTMGKLSGAAAQWQGNGNTITVVFANEKVMFKSFGDVPAERQGSRWP